MAGASPVQTQEDLVPPAPAAIGYRLTGVLLAPAVAVAVQVVLSGPFGLTLQIPEGPGSAGLRELDLLTTTLMTLGIGLVGWFAVMGLERSLGGERGRRLWTLLAVGVFVVSVGAIALLDVPVGAQWGLFVLHLAVAAVLLPTLANGRPAEHPVAGGWVATNVPAAAAQEDTHTHEGPPGAHADPHAHDDPAHTAEHDSAGTHDADHATH